MTKTTKALAKEATGPLAGVRIIDLTSVVLGAYATQIMGDMGADVIKVESPHGDRGLGGDVMRWAGTAPNGINDLGPIFVTINRNKRSLLLDLKDEKAKRALKRLIKTADVFTANVRYEGLKRMGLSYEDVAAIKPDIVYVHAAGYGSDGPYAGLPAYDDLIQAGAGMADLLNRADGTPEPKYIPTLVADKVTGLFMVQATLAALFHKQRTGEGQFVEVPMLECMTSFTLAEHFFGQVYDPPTGQWAYTRVASKDRRPFKTKDGHIGLMPYNNKQWDAFFELDGRKGVVSNDPRFATYETRTKHIGELYGMIEDITVHKTTAEWLAILKPLDIPAVKMNKLDDLPEDPHLKAVEFFAPYEHPEIGRYYSMKPPMKFSKTPANIRRHPPRLGEHTEALMAEAGVDEEEKA
jgi:crotonobetainyl-CoA:carnitine CoA-transferase CaiB-like acyl-CoA transferase